MYTEKLRAKLVGEYYKTPNSKVLIFKREHPKQPPSEPNDGLFWLEVTIPQPKNDIEDMYYDLENPVIMEMMNEFGEDVVLEFFKKLVWNHDISWYMSYRRLIQSLKERTESKNLKKYVKSVISQFEKTYGGD